MNNTGPLSPPTSIASNDWSDRPPRGPHPPHGKPLPPNAEWGRRNLATPPVSGQMNGYAHPPSSPGGPNGRGPPPHGYRGNPSPPNSVAARSSSGTQVSVEAQRRKQEMIENMLGQSYGVLKRHLANQAADGKPGRRPNKARHKLVQLTPMQFQELSKDVCDELMRRSRHEQWQKQGGNGPEPPKFLPPMEDIHPKRNQARQTLSELPDERFLTLASDTFFEIERRVPRIPGGDIARGGSPANSVRGPPGRTGTPPNGMRPGSRDQMRRPPPRQNSLGGQVLAGLGIPGVDDYNRPAPKATQANTMVPNKSYLVEDDDDGESVYDLSRRHTGATAHSFGSAEKAEFQEKVNTLEGRVDELQKELRERDSTIQQLREKDSTIQQLESNLRDLENSHQGLESSHRELESSHRELESTHMGHQEERQKASDEWDTLRSDLEAKLDDAQSLNDRLQAELDRLQAQHGERERDLTRQIGLLTTQSSDADGQWRTRHDALQAGHESLQARHSDLEQELADQRRATDEVRKELVGFVGELGKMSERSDQGWKKEEALRNQLHEMEADLKEWKSRYAQASARPTDASSVSTYPSLQLPGFEQLEKHIRPDGLVPHQHLADLTFNMNEYISAAHHKNLGALLPSMKAVRDAVTRIRDDTKHAAYASKLRARVLPLGDNFMTGTFNFLYAPDASPVMLLDAAASHLMWAVIGLVQTVGMQPHVNEEQAAFGATKPLPAAAPRVSSDDDDDDDFDLGAYDQPEGQAASVNGSRSSASESVYSLATAATAVPAGHGRKASGPAGTRLTSASYQAPRAAHARQASAAGMVNGQSGSTSRNAAHDFQEADEDLAELKHFLDEQSGPLTETINSLLGAIRRNAPRHEIQGLVKRIIDVAAHILRNLQAAADAWPTPALGDALAPHCGALADGRKSLLAAAHAVEAGDAADADPPMSEPEYRKAVNAWPPVAFKIAGALRELGASVDEVAQGHLGDGEDFR